MAERPQHEPMVNINGGVYPLWWLMKKYGITAEMLKDGCVSYEKLDDNLRALIEDYKLDHEKIQELYNLLASLGGDEHFKGAWSADEVYSKYDLVYHLGCKWMCLLDNTTEEPTWYADTWLYMSGDNRFKIDIDSSAGTSFRGSSIDTVFDTSLWFGSFNVTEKFCNQNGRKIVWSRDTGNATKDKAWEPTVVDDHGMKLRVRLYDVGLDFRERGYTSFTIDLAIPTSQGYDHMSRVINIK